MPILTRTKNSILFFGGMGAFIGFFTLRIGWWATTGYSRDNIWDQLTFMSVGAIVGCLLGLIFGLLPISGKYIKDGDETESQDDS